MVEKIRQRAYNQHSRRIQRAWAKYVDRIIKRRKAEENRKRLLAEADAEVRVFAVKCQIRFHRDFRLISFLLQTAKRGEFK
jgi:hypothetical protein